MQESIEDLIFSPDGSRLLIVTTTQDTLCILANHGPDSGSNSKNKFISIQWSTRNRGIWTTHLSDESRLLLIVNGRMHIYLWEDLSEVTRKSGIEKDFVFPPDLEIRRVHIDWKCGILITEYSAVHRARASIRLFAWDAVEIDAAVARMRPHTLLQVYGDRLATLIGSSGKMIGIERDYIYFLDHGGWIKLDSQNIPDCYRRHMFLPSEY